MVTIADNVTAKAIAPMTMPTSAPVLIPDFELLPISATNEQYEDGHISYASFQI